MSVIRVNPVFAAIMSMLQKHGATEVKCIDAADVIVDDRVRLKCRIPICDSYNKNLMCPPYVLSVDEFRTTLALFSRAILVQISASVSDESEDVFGPAKKLHELINLGEKKAFEEGFRFATGFIGGCCRLCDECVAVSNGTTCRFPFKARPSMEAVGIDVIATLERAGLSAAFPIGDRVNWTGLILMD
jgi:predicted metal-binding protein